MVQTSLRAPATAAARRSGPPVAALGGSLLALAVLAVVAVAVYSRWSPVLTLDRSVAADLYAGDDRPAALTALLEVLTAPGATAVRMAVLLPVAGWVLLRHHARGTAAWVVLTGLLIGPLTTALKESAGRVRPPFADGGASLDSLSFPSGHSSGIATFVVVLLVLAWPRMAAHRRQLAVLAGVAAAVLVGLTRMWLGVHYLSDVVAGLAFGTAWPLLTAWAAGVLPGGRRALPSTSGKPG